MLPYFRKAEHNERLSDDWHGQNGPLNVAELQSPNVFSKRFVEAGVQAGWAHNPDFNGANQEGVGFYQTTTHDGRLLARLLGGCSALPGPSRPASVPAVGAWLAPLPQPGAGVALIAFAGRSYILSPLTSDDVG